MSQNKTRSVTSQENAFKEVAMNHRANHREQNFSRCLDSKFVAALMCSLPKIRGQRPVFGRVGGTKSTKLTAREI